MVGAARSEQIVLHHKQSRRHALLRTLSAHVGHMEYGRRRLAQRSKRILQTHCQRRKDCGNQGPFQGDYVPVGSLYLGSERGATDQRGRTTKADFAALRLFDGPLLDTEIHDLFLQTAPTYHVSMVVPPRLQARYEMVYTPRRDANGTLLECRVMFDEDMHWAYSTAQADAILQRVKAAGCNVYV